MPSVERMVTLTCVSNEVGGDLAGNARWQGVRLADVLAMAGPQAGADCVLSTSFDGFTVTTPLAALTDGRDAHARLRDERRPAAARARLPGPDGRPGTVRVRLRHQMGRRTEVTKFAEESAYWTERGWAPQAPIKTASRIDVPKPASPRCPRARSPSPAWRGRSTAASPGVQVRIDGGAWQDATLSGEVSADTWRQWVYQWDATTTGQHTIECRAIDGTGTAQTEQVQGVMPDGATGLDSRSVTVTV